MSRLDLVIFGATGFTGKRAVEEVVRAAPSDLTWAVAGRSQEKLDTVLAEVSKKTGKDLSSTKVIIAEVKDDESLKAMCLAARAVVNCCGPYRLYGEPVVRAAIEARTHYVDVSGEPQFIEGMQLRYGQQAKENGVYIVSACGLDSIPNDYGVVYLQKHFEGTLNSVESYLTGDLPSQYRAAAKQGVLHYGTWESLVHSLAHWGELSGLRKQMYPDRLPTFKPKLLPRSTIHKHEGGWCLPFPGADGSIVYRTQRFFYENYQQRPVQFKPYVKFPKLFHTVLTIIGSAFLYLMSQLSLTRSLLLAHPRLFSLGLASHEGPTEEVMDNTSFSVELYGTGWNKGADLEATPPSKKVVAKVSGMNPGYGATATMLIFAAITILKESDKMPDNGGVLTTGAAFRDTALAETLTQHGVKFEILDN